MSYEIIDSNTIFGPWPQVLADMSPERLVQAMNSHGVGKSLAISTVGVLHGHGDGNAETLRVCSQFERFIPVATIDPRGYFGPAGTVGKIAEQGFRIFQFFPVFQGWRAEHASFHAICEELDALGLPIIIQAPNTNQPTEIANVLGGKNCKVILDAVCFENMAETVAVMRKFENILVNTRELRVPGALRFLTDQIGSDRVVFASGCLRTSLAAAQGYVMDAEISDEAKASIFSGNIKRLLGGA